MAWSKPLLNHSETSSAVSEWGCGFTSSVIPIHCVWLRSPGFTSHQTVARTAGNVLLRLADSLIIPFNPSDYAETVEQYYSTAADSFTDKMSTMGISLGKGGRWLTGTVLNHSSVKTGLMLMLPKEKTRLRDPKRLSVILLGCLVLVWLKWIEIEDCCVWYLSSLFLHWSHISAFHVTS